MSKDDINKAKAENAERIANIAYSGGGHIGQDDLKTAFENGAEWRINKMWHNADEVPKKKGYILVWLNGDYPIFVTWNINVVPTNWDKIAKENNVVKWAYVKDLIPNMEE